MNHVVCACGWPAPATPDGPGPIVELLEHDSAAHRVTMSELAHRYLMTHGAHTAGSLAALMEEPYPAVIDALRSLQREGVVVARREHPANRWAPMMYRAV
ncbi:MAG: hypothetical protein ACSLE9_08060 [Burkholderiaceae bacterium]